MHPKIASFLLVFSTLFAHCTTKYYSGDAQSTAVRGTLQCDGSGIAGVKVKLYDVDTLDPDDLMAEAYTDSDGKFLLSGHEREVGKITPKLNIYHKCRDPSALCTQKIAILVPEHYISLGEVATSVFDIGTLNLNEKHEGESMDCLN